MWRRIFGNCRKCCPGLGKGQVSVGLQGRWFLRGREAVLVFTCLPFLQSQEYGHGDELSAVVPVRYRQRGHRIFRPSYPRMMDLVSLQLVQSGALGAGLSLFVDWIPWCRSPRHARYCL